MADERPGRARTVAAVVIIILSGVALVATSPAQIESRLDASGGGGGEVTAAGPRTSGVIALELTAEALPDLVGSNGRLSGTVTFGPPQISEGHVAMEVSSEGLESPAPSGDSGTSWPLELVCAIAEPCRREFEISLTWLDPVPGATAHASFSATVEVIYSEIEDLPAGAEAAWTTVEPFEAVALEAALSATTGREQIRLDADHPAAARHVALTATGDALRGLVSAFVTYDVTQAEQHEVRVSVLSDEAVRDERPVALGRMESFTPFADCPPDGDCSAGMTVLFELASSERDAIAVVDWSLSTSAVFPDGAEVSDDASLSAELDGVIDWGEDAETITATATGSFNARSSTTIQVIGNAAAMDREALGGVRPQGIAVLSVDGAPELTVSIDGDPLVPIPGGGGYVDLRASGESAAFFPMRHCLPDEECVAEIWLTGASNQLSPAAEGEAPVMIDWSLEVLLPYPGGTPPDDAALRIESGG